MQALLKDYCDSPRGQGASGMSLLSMEPVPHGRTAGDKPSLYEFGISPAAREVIQDRRYLLGQERMT